MTDRVCGVCETGHVSPDHYVCRDCTGTYRGLLTDLAGLFYELDLVITRQTRYTTPMGRRGGEMPLPYNPHASETAHVTKMTLLIHVDDIATIRGHKIPQTPAQIETYLRNASDWLTRHPDGPMRIDEIIAALREARHAIDRPRERRYIGTCGTLIEIDGTPTDCPEELYTARDTVDCPRCGTNWNTTDRQIEMLNRLRDHLMPAPDLARTLTIYGHPTKPNTIRQWRRRGHLNPDTVNPEGQPLYRLGDALQHIKKEPA